MFTNPFQLYAIPANVENENPTREQIRNAVRDIENRHVIAGDPVSALNVIKIVKAKYFRKHCADIFQSRFIDEIEEKFQIVFIAIRWIK